VSTADFEQLAQLLNGGFVVVLFAVGYVSGLLS